MEELNDWTIYLDRAKFLIQHEYVSERDPEELAKKLLETDKTIRANANGSSGITNVKLYD